jgi:Flp pilus assembly pilin Flp
VTPGEGVSQDNQEAPLMAALGVHLQNTLFNLRERQEGQTMAEYALILGGIAIVVILALVFLGGRIRDLFEATGSSVTTPVS